MVGRGDLGIVDIMGMYAYLHFHVQDCEEYPSVGRGNGERSWVVIRTFNPKR